MPKLLAGQKRHAAPARQRQVQRRLTPKPVAQLVAEYEAGADMKLLANEWKLHRTTVAGHLRDASVPLRRQGITDEQLPQAIRLYGQGWSCRRLGERFGCVDETVRQRLKGAGVMLRDPWERP